MTAVERSPPFSTILPWLTRKTLRGKHTGSKRFWLWNTNKNVNTRIESSCRNRF